MPQTPLSAPTKEPPLTSTHLALGNFFRDTNCLQQVVTFWQKVSALLDTRNYVRGGDQPGYYTPSSSQPFPPHERKWVAHTHTYTHTFIFYLIKRLASECLRFMALVSLLQHKIINIEKENIKTGRVLSLGLPPNTYIHKVAGSQAGTTGWCWWCLIHS